MPENMHYGHINDNLTNGFYRGIRKYRHNASQYSDSQIANEASRLGKQVKKVSDVLHVLASGADDDETMLAKALLDKIYKILPQYQWLILWPKLSWIRNNLSGNTIAKISRLSGVT